MERFSEKIDTSFQLALQIPQQQRRKSESLSSGFDEETGRWEVILRVEGDVEQLRRDFSNADLLEVGEGYVIGLVPQTELDRLAKRTEVIYMEQPKRIQTAVAQGVRASCIWPLQQEVTPMGYLSGRGVFVGMIDSSIDYFHPDFRNPDGTTRIEWLYADGVAYDSRQINEALEADTREAALSIVPVTDSSGHGTHVAGIAAGNGRASAGRNRGIAYESPLIVVKLGNTREGGFPKTTQLMEAVAFVRDKAKAAGMPVAVNISFGNNYGSHTGTSLLETYLSQMATTWKMSIVTGMGNEGNGAGHREGTVTSEQAAEEVELSVDDYETSLTLQLWKNYQDPMDVVFLAPDNSEVARLPDTLLDGNDGEMLSFTWKDTRLYIFWGMPSPYSIYQEIYAAFLPAGDYLDSGVWKIRLESKGIKDGTYAMWLPEKKGLNSRTGFLEPSQDTTLTIPATARNLISVGAYDSRRNQYASFSGRGFTWETKQVKPDLVAPGVSITSCDVGGGYAVRSGTSMAAPFVTGSAALLMQWGIAEGNDPYLYGEKLKAYLIRGAEPFSGELLPSKRVGWGKLCLDQSL